MTGLACHVSLVLFREPLFLSFSLGEKKRIKEEVL